MIIRQEEETPIGNYFHDSGIMKLFSKITDTVDEFEVDTERIKLLCDELSIKARQLRNFITYVEKEELKKSIKKEIQGLSLCD